MEMRSFLAWFRFQQVLWQSPFRQAYAGSRKREYREAYQAQLQALHRVLLEGERLEPPKLKALLNREAREGALRPRTGRCWDSRRKSNLS